MTNYYTENLAEFGYREIEMLSDLLNAWMKDGLPDGFDQSGIKPAMNKLSGYVFLINDEFQVAMLNGDELEIFHSFPYSGAEGFLSELIEEHDPASLNKEDVEYVIDAAKVSGIDLPENWRS